jgi:UDP-glucose 4-epimerase
MGDRRIVVTGGCGFIGSHLVDSLLADGHTVCVVDDLSTGRQRNLNPAATLIEADVADEDSFAEALHGAGLCYHLAAVASVARSIEAWRASSSTNLVGSVAVFEACARAGVPVVYASSAAVYGAPSRVPLDENAPTAPTSPYGVDKLSAELHARAGGRCIGLASAGLRLFNVYGPRQDPASPYSGVISLFAGRARSGADLDLHGDGGQTRDFIHVKDVVTAFRAAPAAASSNAPVFNVATGVETTVSELAKLIIDLTGASSSIRRAPARPGDIPRSCGDASALRALGWSAKVSLREGLANLLCDTPAL